jgi:hypothetical protein
MTAIYEGATPDDARLQSGGFKYLSTAQVNELRSGTRLAKMVPGLLGKFEVTEVGNEYLVKYNNQIFGGIFNSKYTAFGSVMGTYLQRGGTASSETVEEDLKLWSPHDILTNVAGWWNSQNKTIDANSISMDVTALADLSGNGNDMEAMPTTNLPSVGLASTLNNIKGIRFTSGEALKSSDNVGDIDAQAFDMFVVLKGETSGNSSGIEYALGWGSNTDGHAVGYYDLSSFGVSLYYFITGGSSGSHTVSPQTLESAGAILGLGKKDSTYARILLNGSEQKQFLYDTNTNPNHVFLGTRASVAPTLNATVWEAVCLLNNSSEERQLTEGYLAHKYGLEGSLPSDHPYKTSAPVS